MSVENQILETINHSMHYVPNVFLFLDLSSNDHNDQARDVPNPLQKMSLMLENLMGIPV